MLWFRALLLLLGLVVLATLPRALLAAQPPILALTAGMDQASPLGHLQAIRVAGEPAGSGVALSKDQQAASMLSAAMPAARPEQPEFGYTNDSIWLRLQLQRSADAADAWLLRSRVRYLRPFDAWISIAGGPPQPLYHNSAEDPFSARPVPHRHILFPLDLPADTPVTLLMRFRSGGITSFPFELVTPARFASEDETDDLAMAVFLAVLATLALLNLGHFIALRHPAHVFYVLQEVALALYVAHLQGYTFQYLWPDSPAWNAMASPVLGNLTLLATLAFAMSFLRTAATTPRMHRLLQIWGGLVLLALCSNLVLDIRLANQFSLANSLVGTLLVLSVACLRAWRRDSDALFFLAAWAARLIGVVPFLLGLLGLGVASGAGILYALETGMVLQAVIFSVGLTFQIRRLNTRLLGTMQRRLNDARERVRLEQEKEQALKTLLTRSKALADTSHDLAQPVRALRLTLHGLRSRVADAHLVDSMDQTLADLQDLLSGLLDSARREEQGSLPTPAPASLPPLAVGQVLDTVATSLKASATEAGVTLRVRDSPMVARAPELALKRALGNLLGNVLQHSGASRVLLAARQRSKAEVVGVELLVCDNGQGMDADTLAAAQQRHHSGGHSSGLGLAIVQEICHANGWQLHLRSRPGHGTTASIWLPGLAAG